MPRTKKPAGVAVDPRNGRRAELALVAGERFDPPEGLSEQALEYWDAYWDDAVAGVLTKADRPLLLRWISEYDRYLRLTAEADLEPMVRGSQGQPVENPLYGTAHRSLLAVQYLEKQLGMGPLNRSALGIAVISERKSLADMNAQFSGGGRVDGGSVAAAPARRDPRVIDAG